MQKSMLKRFSSKNAIYMSYAWWYNSIMNISEELLQNISKNYIWIVRFSDSTALLNAITYHTGCITIYGYDYAFSFWIQEWWIFFNELVSLFYNHVLPSLS